MASCRIYRVSGKTVICSSYFGQNSLTFFQWNLVGVQCNLHFFHWHKATRRSTIYLWVLPFHISISFWTFGNNQPITRQWTSWDKRKCKGFLWTPCGKWEWRRKQERKKSVGGANFLLCRIVCILHLHSAHYTSTQLVKTQNMRDERDGNISLKLPAWIVYHSKWDEAAFLTK